MTLVLSNRVELLLVKEAARQGLSPDVYAEILLRRVLNDTDEMSSENVSTVEIEKRPRFGSAKGLVFIADDFDDPLEDLQEYMY